MQMQSNGGRQQTNPVFIPKRTESQRKGSFVANGYHNKFRHKEISVNGSTLPNNFKRKAINSLKRQSIHTIPVEAEVHHQRRERDIDQSTNGTDDTNNKNSKTMTAIKGILKSKTSESVANGVISGGNQLGQRPADRLTHHSLAVSHSHRKTHNPSDRVNNRQRQSTETENDRNDRNDRLDRRKSWSVQFDIHDIKESTRVELNRGLTSLSSARRESSNSSSSLSIIQQSVPQNPVLTYDFPKSTQRISDLRKILNPEIEKEDSFKKLGDRLIHCECFELNLNNAAKIITALVLTATIILVLRALFHLFH